MAGARHDRVIGGGRSLMAPWFFRGLRKGVVTTRYPKIVDPWARTLRTAPAFHPERLTVALAERLAQICPGGAITREGSELIIDLGHCTGCGLCFELGDEAVEPSGLFLLATGDRAALVKRVAIRGDGEGTT